MCSEAAVCPLAAGVIPKEATDANVGEIIAAASNGRAIARVVTVLRMIKRLLHEPGERLRAIFVDLVANDLDERAIQSENVRCLMRNVQPQARSELDVESCARSVECLLPLP